MDAQNAYKTSTYTQSLKTIIRSDGEENLGTVLSLVTSSHTPVFIFDKNNTFLGLISPYQAIYFHNYPYRTKAAHLALMPPYLSLNTPLYTIASYMLASRLYLLPVFDEHHTISGIISIKKVLQGLATDPDFLTYLSTIITPRKPVTADVHATVGEVYQIMKHQKVSRVVLIEKKGHVAGILSRKDLLKLLASPTPKQRFGKNGFRPTDWAFDAEKIFRKDDPVITYATEFVQKILFDIPQKEVISQLLFSQNNSIVLINHTNKPVGFLSLRDIIKGLATLEPLAEINLIITKPTGSVTPEEIEKAHDHVKTFGQKMNRRTTIEKIEVSTEEPKYAEGKTAAFNTTLIMTPIVGKKYVAKTQRNAYLDSVQAATDHIAKQERRSGKDKEETIFANL